MKASEIQVGSVVYLDNDGRCAAVVLSIDDVDVGSRWRKTMSKRVSVAKMYLTSPDGEFTYHPEVVTLQRVTAVCAPDVQTAMEKIRDYRRLSMEQEQQRRDEQADRKARMAKVFERMAEIGLKQSEYAADHEARTLKLSLADIEALLARVA